MYKQKLCFSHLNDQLSSNDALEFQLPNIARHVPAGFDIEQSHGLFELYRAHCTSLVDSVRYVKEKQFFKLIGSFNGTMTVPVARLFQQPPISAWIKDCDTVLYQQIIKFVSQLVLQVLPTPVFMMLRNIGNELIDVIKKHFYHFPTHVLEAKLETATIFCSLLQRMLRVNETAHAAANLLMKDDMRAIMWADWVSSIKPRRVVESSLARCGHEEAFNILTADMRLLLAPLPHDAIVEPSDFANATHVIGPEDWQDYSTADTIMERWSTFLKKLPARFPDVPTRTLLHCLESVGCAALRDITVNVAQSFGAWWTTKVWMDEMMLWLAEMGGFLDADGGGSSPSTNPYDDNIDSVMRNPLHEMPNNVSRPATASELPRPNSAHPNLEYGGFSGFSPQLQGQRHSSGPPTATCKTTLFHLTSTPKRKEKRVTFASPLSHEVIFYSPPRTQDHLTSSSPTKPRGKTLYPSPDRSQRGTDFPYPSLRGSREKCLYLSPHKSQRGITFPYPSLSRPQEGLLHSSPKRSQRGFNFSYPSLSRTQEELLYRSPKRFERYSCPVPFHAKTTDEQAMLMKKSLWLTQRQSSSRRHRIGISPSTTLKTAALA